jgi:hypothetical protein
MMMRRWKNSISMILFCAWLMPLQAHAQTKSIIIGEGVRGAMYLPAYIAEEKVSFAAENWTRRS